VQIVTHSHNGSWTVRNTNFRRLENLFRRAKVNLRFPPTLTYLDVHETAYGTATVLAFPWPFH
jgi:hypothetical protein